MRNVARYCIVTVCFCVAALGTEDGGNLHGVVMDFTGAVIPNAMVRIEHWDVDAHPIVREDTVVTTGRDGSYSVSLKPGLYDVFVSFSAFSPVAKKVKLEAGKPSEYSPKLELDPLTKYVPVQANSGPPIPKDH